MINIIPINTANEHYIFVEELLISSFPPDERRNSEKQRLFSDTNPLFHCHLIKEGETPIGFINYWELDDFIFIEHFAISPILQNKGYGTMSLKIIIQKLSKPFILEVERPDNDISKRRIGFYLRAGFTLHKQPYLQPPYEDSEKPVPMYLMSFGDVDMKKQYHYIRRNIYKEVYQYTGK